ncbi:MAG: exodeoxyribonuclease I [Gammaproteobacteria bacterium]|nr:MAG: exodeoxyribonuclease I [Gammaproteobacteria bacterium]
MTEPVIAHVSNKVTNTLYWHDYETWGEVPAQDRPSQFAGVRTDENLNIVGEPLMIYCKPAPDTLPKPDACLITGLTPQVALAKGLPEYQFAAKVHAELSQPGTCGVGYNSIRFDDEVTRFMLYRNFYDSYEREWRNGNSRWDIIDVVRTTRALRPEGINWPNYEDGKPCFKLEKLTAANNLNHEAAHDALSDVYATIGMAKLIKTHQPKLFDYAYRLRDKRFVNSLIDIPGHKPLLHISSRFAGENGNATLVLPLAIHPTNKNSVIAYNLAFNPRDLLTLSADDLRERLFTRSEDLPAGIERVALKEIHLNKSPMLLPPNMLDDATAQRLKIDRNVLEQHWQQLRNLSLIEQEALQEKLYELYSEIGFIEKTDPDQMLYSGFFDDADKKLMAQVRRASPEQLASKSFDFTDARLDELLFRYRARNFPHTLTSAEQQQWSAFCHLRHTDSSAGASVLAVDLHYRVNQLLQLDTTTEPQKHILHELIAYAEAL